MADYTRKRSNGRVYIGQVKPEQDQHAHHNPYGKPQAHIEEPSRRAQPRHQGSRKKQPANEVAQVGHVVDMHSKAGSHGADANDEIDGGKVNHRPSASDCTDVVWDWSLRCRGVERRVARSVGNWCAGRVAASVPGDEGRPSRSSAGGVVHPQPI
jgi:hypothetical protein